MYAGMRTPDEEPANDSSPGPQYGLRTQVKRPHRFTNSVHLMPTPPTAPFSGPPKKKAGRPKKDAASAPPRPLPKPLNYQNVPAAAFPSRPMTETTAERDADMDRQHWTQIEKDVDADDGWGEWTDLDADSDDRTIVLAWESKAKRCIVTLNMSFIPFYRVEREHIKIMAEDGRCGAAIPSTDRILQVLKQCWPAMAKDIFREDPAVLRGWVNEFETGDPPREDSAVETTESN